MGITVWIILGLISGIVARNLIPGGNPERLIIATLIGIAGAFLGGFVTTRLFMTESTQGLFDLSTWVTAAMGAAGMLLFLFTYHLITRHQQLAPPPLGQARATPPLPSSTLRSRRRRSDM